MNRATPEYEIEYFDDGPVTHGQGTIEFLHERHRRPAPTRTKSANQSGFLGPNTCRRHGRG